MKSTKGTTFAKFCKQHNVAQDGVKWKTVGEKKVNISIDKSDFKDGGWNLISVGLMVAMRELGVSLDITVRENQKEIEIIVEK